MGLFRVRERLIGPTGRSEDPGLLVDTGATLLVVPRSLAERLELVARRSQQVLIAGGRRGRIGARWERVYPRCYKPGPEGRPSILLVGEARTLRILAPNSDQFADWS